MKIKTAIILDPVGHSFGEVGPDEEMMDLVAEYSKLVRPHILSYYKCEHACRIQPGTKLVLFDYGGMLGIGNTIAEEQSRDVIRFAENNPSALVVIVSDFTYRQCIRYEMEDMGLNLHNVVHNENVGEDPIPWWFRFKNAPFSPIAGLTPLGLDLAGIQFFKPTNKFLEYMNSNFKKAWIYEVGAGMGHASKLLKDEKFHLIEAIDSSIRDGAVYPVEIADGTNYKYDLDSTILICRPCHGLFCEAVIEQSIRRRASAIIYVGLSKNAGSDLGRFRKLFKFEAAGVGEDKERVYVWRPEWNQNLD